MPFGAPIRAGTKALHPANPESPARYRPPMRRTPSRSYAPASALIAALLAASCRQEAPPPPRPEPPAAAPAPLRFQEVARASGVDFRHQNGAEGHLFMLEVMGAGVAAFDCDGDGDQDLLLRQGGAIPTEKRSPVRSTATDRLFRNDSPPGGDWRFVDVTAESG